MFDTIIKIIAFFGTVVTLVVGCWEVYDIYLSRKIKRGVRASLPFRFKRSITNSQFERALDTARNVLDEIRFHPDVVVGVHYQGLSFAALIAKRLYKPVVRAEIIYTSEGDKHIFDSVRLDFDPKARIAHKKVLIVDNSMITGATLRAVKEEIEKFTDQTLTLVVYDKDRYHDTQITPEHHIICFESTQTTAQIANSVKTIYCDTRSMVSSKLLNSTLERIIVLLQQKADTAMCGLTWCS